MGPYLWSDESNNVNLALGLFAPEAEEALFAGTNGNTRDALDKVAQRLLNLTSCVLNEPYLALLLKLGIYPKHIVMVMYSQVSH